MIVYLYEGKEKTEPKERVNEVIHISGPHLNE